MIPRLRLKEILLICIIFISTSIERVRSGWETENHQGGYCALYGFCGVTDQGSLLPCAANIEAQPIDSYISQKIAQDCPLLWPTVRDKNASCCDQISLNYTLEIVKLSEQLLNTCPACYTNFVNLWCTLSCSPDQATFSDVVRAQKMEGFNDSAALEVNYYLSDDFKNNVFNSCKDVKLASLSLTVFSLFFEDVQTPDELLEYLGKSEADGGYAPYTLNFPPEEELPPDMQLLDDEIPTCSSTEYACSCGDCPDASYCSFVLKPPEEDKDSFCIDITLFHWTPFCSDFIIAIIGTVVVLILTIALFCKTGCLKYLYDTSTTNAESEHSYDPLLTEGGVDNSRKFHINPNQIIIYSKIEQFLRHIFRKQGVFVAKYPVITIFMCLCAVAVCSAGLMYFEVETTAYGLWVPPNSRSAIEKEKYDESFGSFYRLESIVITTTPESAAYDNTTSGLPQIITEANMALLFDLHDILKELTTTLEVNGETVNITLEDVCYKPTDICLIQSVAQYWQLDYDNWSKAVSQYISQDEYISELTAAQHCFDYWTTDCYSNYYAPIDPKTVIGGFAIDESFTSYSRDSTAFVITYLLDSSKEKLDKALAWEAAYIEVLKNELTQLAEYHNLAIYFFAESSIEAELARESYADALTVAVSYLVMFIYIAVALSLSPKIFKSIQNFFVNTRVVLALEGIIIVILSVLAAMGLCSWFKLKASLIIMEVIPFLILAVGVDNMFILANELHYLDPSMPLEVRVGEALATVGPSITLAAVSEALAFGIASFTILPAVRAFAICACIAIVLDFLLQITAFAALLSLDVARIEASRVDIAPCIKIQNSNPELEEYLVSDIGTPSQEASSTDKEQTLLQLYITRLHIPILVWPKFHGVRSVMLILTVIFFFVCLALMFHMERGLEEQVIFPRDSYLQGYYTDALLFLRIGPPVMFAVNDFNISLKANEVNKVCAISGCNPDSLVSQISLAAQNGAYYIASPSTSWLDDFLMWNQLSECCQINPNDETFCLEKSQQSDDCEPCTVSYFANERPTISEFQLFLPEFMDYTPNIDCGRGGKGLYDDSIQHAKNDTTDITGLSQGLVTASSFRSFYIPLVTQADFIGSLESTQEFVDNLKADLGLDIYGYSPFHAYFQSYLTIEKEAIILLSLAIILTLIVSWIILGSLQASLVILLCIMMIVIDLWGISYLCNVQLNGVSVVNVTMGIGIAIEFCVHIAHAFVVLPGSTEGRLIGALEGVGSSVISGITLTKFVGVIVLSFAQTQIFEIYYFRMYLALVLLGAWHGLVILPIFLGIFNILSLPVKKLAPSTNNNNNNDNDVTA